MDRADAVSPSALTDRPSLLRAGVLSPLLFIAAFALLPLVVAGGDGAFLLTIAARIMIFALAALSLDLILGYGAMVSFGHAAFVGIGAYVIGISAEHFLEDLALTLPLALFICAAFGLLMGAVSVRTSGIQFIMITLALSQMAYFGATSLARYGGDDGLTLWSRSTVFGSSLLENDVAFYYAVVIALALCYGLCALIVRSRFGRVLSGIRQSDKRMSALGYPVDRYRLVAFVIAGAICGVSGVLLANLTEFVSPAYMSWGRSADLIIILVIGGIGRLHGALWGALILLGLEDAIPFVFKDVLATLFPADGEGIAASLHATSLTIAQNWKVVLGPILILVALYARGGIVGVFSTRKDGP